ncbi:histidine phosphatase family protein [Massilia sp. CCM 8695]|uniref:Histidine phosphatase family protein n=1 Tax=Massilia frigida TaxID=2609281 RepID=A0ABX0NEB4_9BURK|nr:histidine phosphatase family protein [Massilia frigida]NHZ83807.1 histidine phosphatase family protein [Massilia frigida]
MPTLTVRFIRHGESAANAGAATSDPANIPLTQLGHEQAQAISNSFGAAPDLIVYSPFQRVRQTAAPTLAHFAAVPVEAWPIQEFTYLAPARCAHTTPEQRRPWAAQFWDAADTLAIDGPEAESFAAFMWRVSAALDRLAGLPLASVALFGHGQHMQAVRWSIAHRPQIIDADAMRAFRAFDLSHPIANAAGFEATCEAGIWALK